jgi:carboxypeptidase family protein
MKLLISVMLFAAVLFIPTSANAQFDTGAVLGSVRDSTGAVLPGVTVTLRNVATGVTAVKATDERGAYEFFTVRPGDYTVSAELSGFSTRTISEPAVRQRVEKQRTRAGILAGRSGGQQERRVKGIVTAGIPNRSVQSAQSEQLPRAEREQKSGGVRHDHGDLRPTAAAARREVHLVAGARSEGRAYVRRRTLVTERPGNLQFTTRN